MKILLICLLSAALIITFLLFVKLNFSFEGYYDDSVNKNFTLRFFVFNKKLGFNIKFKETKKEKEKKEIEKAKGEDKFSDKAERLKNNIIIFKNTFSASKGNIKKMIVVKNINLNMDFGLGDAFATGISTGVLWGVLYSAFALICHLFTVEGHNFSIDPKFNKKIVKVSTNGVIYTRLADVIYTAFVVYKNYKEAKTLFEGYKITAASGDKSASKQEVSKN